jgi:hypothetical protein
MKELRNEVGRLRSDFEQKWSSQIKMVSRSKSDPSSPVRVSCQVDANNRSVFKMHDKMVMLTDWLRSLGTSACVAIWLAIPILLLLQIKC